MIPIVISNSVNGAASVNIYSQTFNSSPADWLTNGDPIKIYQATPDTPPGNSPISGGGVAGKTINDDATISTGTLTCNSTIVTTGYSNIVVYWNQSNTVSHTPIRIEWSLDNGASFEPDYIAMPLLSNLGIWYSQSATLPSTCNNISTLKIRIKFMLADIPSTTSRCYIDDFRISGTPIL